MKLVDDPQLIKIYHHADEIIKNSIGNGLWIGDLSSAEDLQWLKQHNIKTVITAAVGCNVKYSASIRHFKYDFQDKSSQNVKGYFDRVAFQIKNSLKIGSTLVHCAAGVSRSTTLVIAYLIKYREMSFMEALKLCKAKRPQVCPNLGFELQLKSYERLQHQIPLSESAGLEKSSNQLPMIKPINYNATLYSNFAHSKHSFPKQVIKKHSQNHKNQKKEEKQKKSDVSYLKKIAEFRFGVTNMQRWKLFDLKNLSAKLKN